MHSDFFEFYKLFYYYNYISKYDVWQACQRGEITRDEYKEITGEEWTTEFK